MLLDHTLKLTAIIFNIMIRKTVVYPSKGNIIYKAYVYICFNYILINIDSVIQHRDEKVNHMQMKFRYALVQYLNHSGLIIYTNIHYILVLLSIGVAKIYLPKNHSLHNQTNLCSV